MTNTKNNLEENLKKLEEIANYFENQENLDIEIGLKKIEKANEIIKESREKLKNIENKFKEITK